jgi:hypothetical protein
MPDPVKAIAQSQNSANFGTGEGESPILSFRVVTRIRDSADTTR